ncbi:MAG: 16S rRNA (cytosine(1402)-N(4))-methyltransferase RsmH [Parachlamydiaceae bacterium]
MTHHTSVLLNELVNAFHGVHLKIFVDATLGAGGHSKAFLEAHPEIEVLIGIDQDPVAREIAKERLFPWENKVKIVSGNFSEIRHHLCQLGVRAVDGIIFDLGVSSMQFDFAEKGFSFMREGPLDMRMDPSRSLTASEIVNTWSESDLGRIFRDYGEEKRWRMAARAIVAARNMKKIETTVELADILRQAIPFHLQKKGIHPATLVFQALRICVNRELEVLEAALPEAVDLLRVGGRLGVISFHSLEDRIVKNFMRFSASDKMNTEGIGGMFLDKDPMISLLSRKPIVPTDDEMRGNPRSRSAKLRVVEKRG